MTVKISNLPAATSAGSGDILPIVQGGTTKKLDLSSAITANLTYDNSTSGLAATDVQDAIDEVSAKTVVLDTLADQRLREAFRKEKSTDVAPSLLLDFAGDKQLDPRITYSRASTATYYDGQTVAKAEENLLTYSQEFDQWIGFRTSITADDTAAPDGNTTADKVDINNTAEVNSLLNSVSLIAGTSYSVSFYIKADTAQYVAIGLYRNNTNANCGAGFDLTSGTVTGTGATGAGYSATNASIVSVGNGWYRCSVTCVSGSFLASTAVFHIRQTAYTTGTIMESFTASGEAAWVWGAQLEQRDSVTAYTPTTTQPITNYIPVLQTALSGDPRFDHDPITGESKGLLIEEQRTNLLTYSEDFSNAAWITSNSSIDSNVISAPDATLTGDKLYEDSSVVQGHSVQENVNMTSGVSYTATVYAKQGERRYIVLRYFSGGAFSTNYICFFDLQTGTATNSSSLPVTSFSITPVGNGWYRCSITQAADATGAGSFRVFLSNDGVGTSYTGDGYSGVYLWGAQLEAGSFPTSYIKTEGSQVTRVADSAIMTGTNFSDWYRPDQGTLYADIEPASLSATSGVVINDNTTSNRIRLATASTSDQGLITANGSAQATLDGGTPAANTSMLLAMAYDTDDFALSLDGATAATDSGGIVPVVSQLQIGAETTNIGNMTIKQFAYYPIRLADATLESITT